MSRHLISIFPTVLVRFCNLGKDFTSFSCILIFNQNDFLFLIKKIKIIIKTAELIDFSNTQLGFLNIKLNKANIPWNLQQLLSKQYSLQVWQLLLHHLAPKVHEINQIKDWKSYKREQKIISRFYIRCVKCSANAKQQLQLLIEVNTLWEQVVMLLQPTETI